MLDFNLLKEAHSISNVVSCRHDNLNGFQSDFSKNGDVDGWDVYSGVCMYGCWNTVLFGTSTENSCFIGRTTPFEYILAEKYYIIKFVMKLTMLDQAKHKAPTKGKVMWTTTETPEWVDVSSKEFELNMSDQWYTYIINVGESSQWLGNINNLRIFPMIDGFPDIQFVIKNIRIDSISDFSCNNHACAYYSKYAHPCQGTGKPSCITSGKFIKKFNTVAGVSDCLIVNIDDYGDEHINLGTNVNVSGAEIAKIMIDRISRLNLGQYAYADVRYIEERGLLSIYSGSVSAEATITVSGSASLALGFVDENNNDISTYMLGESPASGFDYSSSRRLKGFELNALINSDTDSCAYYHNIDQFTVEAGRSEFAEQMTANTLAISDRLDHNKLIDCSQKILIDWSHPINDSGRLSNIWVNGTHVYKMSQSSTHWADFSNNPPYPPKILILRPYKDGSVKIIHSLDIEDEGLTTRYTEIEVTFKVVCNILVNKGDLIGFFNLNVLAPYSSRTKLPNAVYYQVDVVDGMLPTDKFTIGPPRSQGVIGLAYYARSDRQQTNIQLEIDMGKRVNIKELQVYGKSFSNIYEYNVACCLDVSWTVDLHNETHIHEYGGSCVPHGYVAHRNKAYGIECLSDCVTTIDGGKCGDFYTIKTIQPGFIKTYFDGYECNGSDPDTYCGIETFGEHTYFYVNGDMEWAGGGCPGDIVSVPHAKHEFEDYGGGRLPINYEYDPVTFYLMFPHTKDIEVHKTIMYFKEPKNFKRFSLSYYLGENGEWGNAEAPHFELIPDYNIVTLDGTVYYKGFADGENSLTQRFETTLFNNPVAWSDPNYSNGECTNWELFQTQMNTQFNIIKHEFDPVNAKGFMIYCTWHLSTKITELELYSKITVEPTLIDSISLLTSIYGGDWNEVVFTGCENNSEKISAYISGNPRYFRIEVTPQSEFELKEVNAVITDSRIKSLGCGDTLLTNFAPRGVVVKSTTLDIENTFNIPMDLVVDIPTQLFTSSAMLSWLKLDSEVSTINSEIGPGAIVRKVDDYQIELFDSQIAINTPSYYLKNLIDNKNAYVQENGTSYHSFGTLHHGEDIGYSNIPNGRETVAGFKAVSSKYWKFGSYSANGYTLESFSIFYDTSSTIIPVAIKDFSSYSNSTYLEEVMWSQENYFEDGKLLFISYPGDSTKEISKFFIDGDFEIYAEVSFKTIPTICSCIAALLNITSAENSEQQIELYYEFTTNNYANIGFKYHKQNDGWTTVKSTSYYPYSPVYLKLIRSGDVFTALYSYNIVYGWTTLYTCVYTGFSKKVYFGMGTLNYGSSSSKFETYYNDLKIINTCMYLGDLSDEVVVTTPLPIERVYIQSESGEKNGSFETTFNNITNTIDPVTIIDETFTEGLWYDNWNYSLGTHTDNTFVVRNASIYPYIGPNDIISIEKEFLPGVISFELEVDFNFDLPNKIKYSIELLNDADEVVFEIYLLGFETDRSLLEGASQEVSFLLHAESPVPTVQRITNGRSGKSPLIYEHKLISKEGLIYNDDGFKFIVKKSYLTFTEIVLKSTDGSIEYYRGQDEDSFTSRVSKLRISYLNLSDEFIHTQLQNCSTTYINFMALPKLSDKELIVLEFSGSVPIGTIKLLTREGDIKYPVVLLSNTGSNDYREWARGFNTTGSLSTSTHNVYSSDVALPGSTYFLHNPHAVFNDDSEIFISTASKTQFIAYDFGAGNDMVVNKIHIKTAIYSPQQYDYFPVLQVYGSNTYKDSIILDAYGSPAQLLFDLSVATFLTEFEINYISSVSYDTEKLFNNDNSYRYYIFYWPAGASNESKSICLEYIGLYKHYGFDTSSSVTRFSKNYFNYFAIDLGNVHSLDILRNYGPIGTQALLDLMDPNHISYSYTDTGDISQVDWPENSPSVLFNFEDYEDKALPSRFIELDGFFSLYTTGAPVTPESYVGIGIKLLYLGERTASSLSSVGISAYTSFTTVNASNLVKDNDYLSIDLLVSPRSNFNYGYIAISSSDSVGVEEWRYNFNSSGGDPLDLSNCLSESYQTFKLPLSYFEAVSAGSELNLSAIKTVRFFVYAKPGGATLGWRNAFITHQSIISAEASTSLFLSNNDFTIEFRIKRTMLGSEGILSQVDEADKNFSSFSFVFSKDNYLIATLYASNLIFEFISEVMVEDTLWHHIALVRNDVSVSLYIDGSIQCTKSIAKVEINKSTSPLIIGGACYYNFIGYMDELRIINGKSVYYSDFIPTIEEYAIDTKIGSKEAARWVRIAMECGDGINRTLQYIGVYADIRNAFSPTGGINCDWVPIGDALSCYNVVPGNIAPSASVIGYETITDSFTSGISDNWSLISSESTNDIINQTEFSGSHPSSFWRSTFNYLNSATSSIAHSINSLRIELGSSEEGNCVFNTEYCLLDCSCELDYVDQSVYINDGLFLSLSIYSDTGDYWSIVRNRLTISIENNGNKYYNYSTDVSNITGFKIKRLGRLLSFYVYNNDGWIELQSVGTLTADTSPFISGFGVYFELLVKKQAIYPATVIYINRAVLKNEGAIAPISALWSTVTSSGVNPSNMLGYITPEVPIEYGPIFSPGIISTGNRVNYLTYRYQNSGDEGGAGLSIIDYRDNEIFATACFQHAWAIKSAVGWEVVNDDIVKGSWCYVRIEFNWDTATALVIWGDIETGETKTYERGLIYNTNVAKAQIRSTFGKSWQKTFLDVKFDEIEVSPSIQYMASYHLNNCITGDGPESSAEFRYHGEDDVGSDSMADEFENCWGFPYTDPVPTLILDLGATFKVDKFVFYEIGKNMYPIESCSVYGATTTSGQFSLLVSDLGIGQDYFGSANIEPTDVRLIKLTINKYYRGRENSGIEFIPVVINTTSKYGEVQETILDGGFIREFEVWTSTGKDILNSEDHPIVCMDLKDRYNIVAHSITHEIDDEYDNDEQFFQYSSNISDDPSQVSFSTQGGYDQVFSFADSVIGDENNAGPFELGRQIFLDVGYYSFAWNTFRSEVLGQVLVTITGPATIELISKNVNSDGWVQQNDAFKIDKQGYYSIQAHSDPGLRSGEWGVSDLIMYMTRVASFSKWIAIRSNTAVNYSFDYSEFNSIVHYLHNLKVYSSERHRPTESYWWWRASICKLENDPMNVKIGTKSLKITYPNNADQKDTIRFLEGDHFGWDRSWSIKDSLSVWFYIEDIDKLCIADCDFSFGSFDGYRLDVPPTIADHRVTYPDPNYTPVGYKNSSSPSTYTWSFSELNLTTGWNKVVLRFDKASKHDPIKSFTDGTLSSALNFKNYITSSFSVSLRGANDAFYVLLDGIEVERNWYYDEVLPGSHGLCITWNDYVEIPISGADMRKGTVEMTIKLYTDTSGMDHFRNTQSRTLFTMLDSTNNMLSLSIRSGNWFEVGVGDTSTGYIAMYPDSYKIDMRNYSFDIDDVFHIVVAWSNNGTGFTNNDTIRLYINGNMAFSAKVPWEVGDSKNILFRLGGGNTYYSTNDDSDGSAIFSNVKLFNYCKTKFDIYDPNFTDISSITPNNLISISTNNETFYSNRDAELPFEFTAVNPGDVVPIYTKIDKTQMNKLEDGKLTGFLNIEWKMPV